MPVTEMRKMLSRLYGPSWAGKVEKMSDKQAATVYLRKLNEGAFNKEKK
jgi:hypothetical protein